MSLQTLLVSSFLAVAVINCMLAIITLKHIRAEKAPALWEFFINWVMWAIAGTFLALSHAFFEPIFMTMSYIAMVVGSLFFIVAVDKISRDHVNPAKLTISGILGTLYVFSSTLPDATETVPDYGVHVIGLCRIFQILFMFYYTTIFFEWTFSTWKKAPPSLQKEARLLLFGGIVIYPIPLGMYVLATVIIPLGAFPYTVHAAGVLIIVLVMGKEPRLFYVLPFKAHHLVVIHRQSGLSLFQYQWSAHAIVPDIYSSVLHAMQKIGVDILGAGEMKQIELREGTLLLSHRKHISAALLASNSSNYLRNCLAAFSSAFDARLDQLKVPDNLVVERSAFDFGKELIQTHCKNIPSWINEGRKDGE